MEELSAALERYSYLSGLWNEFEPGLISVRDVELVTAKFAGVRIPGGYPSSKMSSTMSGNSTSSRSPCGTATECRYSRTSPVSG